MHALHWLQNALHAAIVLQNALHAAIWMLCTGTVVIALVIPRRLAAIARLGFKVCGVRWWSRGVADGIVLQAAGPFGWLSPREAPGAVQTGGAAFVRDHSRDFSNTQLHSIGCSGARVCEGWND